MSELTSSDWVSGGAIASGSIDADVFAAGAIDAATIAIDGLGVAMRELAGQRAPKPKPPTAGQDPRCEWCGMRAPSDRRGGCGACGAPR
jgi:hypothetical protein